LIKTKKIEDNINVKHGEYVGNLLLTFLSSSFVTYQKMKVAPDDENIIEHK